MLVDKDTLIEFAAMRGVNVSLPPHELVYDTRRFPPPLQELLLGKTPTERDMSMVALHQMMKVKRANDRR